MKCEEEPEKREPQWTRVERWIREIRRKAVKYRRALAIGMSVWYGSLSWGAGRLMLTSTDISILVSESARCFLCKKMSLEYSCIYGSRHRHHTPHTHSDIHTSPPPKKIFMTWNCCFTLPSWSSKSGWNCAQNMGEGRLAFCCQLSWLASVSHS